MPSSRTEGAREPDLLSVEGSVGSSRRVKKDSNDLSLLISGTPNQSIVTPDGDEAIKLSTPQDIANISDVQFKSLTLTDLGASKLVMSNTDKKLISSDVVDWITGTAKQVIVTDNGDGTVTLSLPQDIDTDADVEFDSVTLDDLTALRMVSSDASKKVISITDLTTWIGQTLKQVLVTDDGDGTITLSLPQDIDTDADVEFDTLTLGDMTLGSVIFAGTNGLLSQDNSKLFWDNVNKRLGIETASPNASLQVVGDTHLGEDTTNYADFKNDGELELHGTARVTECLWLPSGGIKAPGSKPATFVESGLTGVWQFADAIAANQESISGTLKIPCNMDKTVAPTFHCGWSADGISPGNCEWQLEYLWLSQNEATNGAAQETLTTTSTASSTSNGFVFATFTGIDLPSATDLAMLYKITRLSADANDTIADTVELRGLAFTRTSNRLGIAI